MIEKPPSLRYEPWQPPVWAVEQELRLPRAIQADDASAEALDRAAGAVLRALGVGHAAARGAVVVPGDDTVEIRVAAHERDGLGIVLFSESLRPSDAFILPRVMIDKAGGDAAEFLYPLTPTRRHHVAVLEALARSDDAS